MTRHQPQPLRRFSGSHRLPKMDFRTLHVDIHKARRRIGHHAGSIHVRRGVLLLRPSLLTRLAVEASEHNAKWSALVDDVIAMANKLNITNLAT